MILFLVDFHHQNLPDPSVLEIFEALKAVIVERDVLCVSAWIEDEVHTKVNVWIPVLIITRIAAIYKLQLVDVPLSGFFIQNSAQIP